MGRIEENLPRPVFMWTLDQIAMVLSIKEETLRISYVWYDRLDAGRPRPDKITARNIAPVGEAREWRVAETELVRWLKYKGFRPSFGRMH